MSKIFLRIVSGPALGQVFEFETHDTFIFGRAPECSVKLPPDDRTASRHHFILEINPPTIKLRDLGSLNGTYVNERKYGGRAQRVSAPAEEEFYSGIEVVLKDGDQIKVGSTTMNVQIEHKVSPSNTDTTTSALENKILYFPTPKSNISVPSEEERLRLLSTIASAGTDEEMHCSRCGKDVVEEAIAGHFGTYICKACRSAVIKAPSEYIKAIKNSLEHKASVQGLDIGGLQIIHKLGQGGFGAVYLAHRLNNGQNVALKVMVAQVAVSEPSRKRFEREIAVMKTLLHPHIVRLFEDGSAGGVFYCLMEFCPGGDLERLVHRHGGCLSLEEATPIMLEVLEGLAYAHQNGFVHRDIKPTNILLTHQSGKGAKLADFGLAKCFELAGLSGMTITGSMMGTPAYMAREQILNFKRVKPVSDVWSLGATFYEMLTGKLPRPFKKAQDPLIAIISGNSVPIQHHLPNLPDGVARVIDKSLAMSVDKRFKDASEMLVELKKYV